MPTERDRVLHEDRFDTGTVEINYAEGPPSGPPFVLLHGGSASWQYGKAFLEVLAERWHVYAPDFRGHGKSGHVPGHYQVRDYSADTAAFLAGVVREPAIIFGHSLGGYTALAVAAEHPDLARAVIDGDATLERKDHPVEEPTHKAQNVLWHMLAGRPVAEIANALKETPYLVPGETTPRRYADIVGEDSPWFEFQAINLHRLDPDMLAAVLAGPDHLLAGYDPERTLPAIACPVLLLQADPAAGGGLPDEDARHALQLLRQGSRVRLVGIGHHLYGHTGQIPHVIQAITPFLEKVRGPENEHPEGGVPLGE
jgi:pimeloyl-ACP methyl ester carboxylesterase